MEPRDRVKEWNGLTLIYQKVPKREVETHSHSGHELFFPIKNAIELHAEGRDLSCSPQQMLYLPALLPHRFRALGEGTGELFIGIIEPKRWAKEKLPKIPARRYPSHQLIKELLFYLLTAPCADETLVRALFEVMRDSFRESSHSETTRVQDPRLQTAIRHLEADLTRAPSIPGLAKLSGASARTLARLFQSELGESPKQFTVRRRMERAKQLLEQGQLGVTEVALEVGYRSLSQFIATFRRLTGQLPSDFFPR